MKRIFILLLATAALASCSKREGFDTPPAPDGVRAITLGTTIEKEIQSKAAAINTTTLTGIHFLKLDATSVPTSLATATPYKGNRTGDATGAITWTAVGGGAATDSDKPIYNKNDQNAYIVGLWPGTAPAAAITAGSKIDWAIDGKTDILVSDIFNAGKYTAPLDGTGVAKFTFKHKLAQLQIVLEAAAAPVSIDAVRSAWGKINKIELMGTKPTATYTYSTNAVTFSGTDADKVLYKDDTFNDDLTPAFDVPASGNKLVNASGMFAAATTGTAKIKIRISSTIGAPQEIDVQLKDGSTDKGFEAGKTHTVTLVLGAADKNISVASTTITDWATGYTGGGAIEK